MLLALRFSLVLLLRRECVIQIDFREFVNQIRQHECVGIIGIEKGTALLREIGLVRFFIDREKELLLKLEQFFLARVLEKGKLGFIDGAALVRVFHHAQKLFVARLTEFHLEHETPPRLDLSLGKLLNRFARYAVAKHILLPHQLLNERFPLVVLMRGNRLLLPGALLGQRARLDTGAKLQPAFYLRRWPFLRSGLDARRLRRAVERRSAPCPRPWAGRIP